MPARTADNSALRDLSVCVLDDDPPSQLFYELGLIEARCRALTSFRPAKLMNTVHNRCWEELKMAKNKEKKKKERERRVAQKKLAAAQKRAQMEATKEAKDSIPRTNKLATINATPKPNHAAANKRSPFIHRRTGG